MNTSILSDEPFKERLRQKWAVWRQERRLYPIGLRGGEGIQKRFVFSVCRKGPNVGGTS